MIRLLLADDHMVVTEGIKLLLHDVTDINVISGKLTLKLTNQPALSIDISREKAPAFKKWLNG